MRIGIGALAFLAFGIVHSAATGQIPAPVEKGPRLSVIPRLRPLDALRATGPFCPGDLTRIKLQVDGQRAQWYFTDYLTTSPVGPFLQKYSIGALPTSLPPDVPATGDPRHVPGAMPSSDGTNDIRFQMKCVRYSRRYGGSIQLIFQLEEAFEYEARFGTTLWDADDTELSLFVTPDFRQFNTAVTPGVLGREPTHLEIKPRILIAYQGNLSQPSTITSDTSSERARFDSLFTTVSTGILSNNLNFRYMASGFAYGFVHYLFRTQLSGTNKVAMMELDERFLALTTKPGVAMVSVLAGISDIDLQQHRFQTGISMSIAAKASWDASLSHTETFDVEDRTVTASRYFFNFPVSACPTTGSPTVIVTTTLIASYIDRDRPTPSAVNSLAINCSQLVADASQSLWGQRQIGEIGYEQLDENNNQIGTAKVVLFAFLQNR